jgi:hypothetical protein
MGITSATCDSILGSGEKVFGRSCINYVKGFKVFGQSELRGGGGRMNGVIHQNNGS